MYYIHIYKGTIKINHALLRIYMAVAISIKNTVVGCFQATTIQGLSQHLHCANNNIQ